MIYKEIEKYVFSKKNYKEWVYLEQEVLDILGVGFGPSNLALAVAIKEYNLKKETPLSALFLEKKEEGFSWHENMQFKDVTIQTPFLKDLVTLNNPQSYYSFLNFLKENDRLFEFVNLHTFFPSRYEFGEYLKWVAERMDELVLYRSEVKNIELIHERNLYKVMISTGDGFVRELLTKNLVIGAGLEPNMPSFVPEDSEKVFHSINFKESLEKNSSTLKDGCEICIVGAGQSAGEISKYIIENTNCSVSVYSRGFVFKGIDATPFVNELYGIKSAEWHFGMSENARKTIADQLLTTNYSVIDTDLAKDLYNLKYEDKVHSLNRFNLHPFKKLEDVIVQDDNVLLIFEDLLEGKKIKSQADIVILATGFTHKNLDPLLSNISGCIKKEDGKFSFNPDYSIRLTDDHLPKIFLQGYGEGTYGVTEGTLAVLPERSHKILSSIVQPAHILV